LKDLKLVTSAFSEQVLVYSPEFELHLKHLLIVLLDFVQLALVSDEVNHHVECQRIAINENTVLLCL
jgi:hypothetical protein